MDDKIIPLFGNSPLLIDWQVRKPYLPVNPVDEYAPRQNGLVLQYLNPEVMEILYYRQIYRVASIAPDRIIILHYEGVHFIYGTCLTPLLTSLRDATASHLQVYNPYRHHPPAPNTPCIKDFEGQSYTEYQERVLGAST